MVRGAVRAVDDELQAVQVEVVREGALAELDVAAGRVVDAANVLPPAAEAAITAQTKPASSTSTRATK